MQRIRTLVWPIHLRPFPVHAVANQPRRDVERVAFVGPPSVDSQGKVFAMRVPMTTCGFLIEARKLTRIVNRTTELVRQNYYMHHGLEVFPVQLIEHFFGIGKDS